MSDAATDTKSTRKNHVDGKVILITGAGGGFGRILAEMTAAMGARVVATDVDGVAASATADAIVAAGGEAIGLAVDVTRRTELVDAVQRAVERWGSVDVLVNNAGVGHKVSVEQEQLDTFRQAMEVNVTAVWHLSKLCAPSMIASGGGSIVNIASMLGHVGATPVKQAHYCASKGAVVNLTRELALQWARKGIRVNALCPGWFPSEMTAGMESDDGSQAFIQQMSPIPRMGHEHELDGALLLLASKASTFLTGQSVIVDGGWTAR